MHPAKVGRYEILREIARSNDIVYEGYDPVASRRVAIKVLNISQVACQISRSDRQSRFLREARAIGQLEHPSIVQIFDAGEDSGQHYMVMQLLEGETLAQRIQRRGALPEDEVFQIADQLLGALEYAHSRGVLHRDIKPQNLFVTASSKLTIADFGIASVAIESTLTQTGSLLGTLHYMSPEQLQGRRAEPGFDLWAAAVVLAECLGGAKPFDGASLADIVGNIAAAVPKWNSTISLPWQEVLGRALAKQPIDRFDDAAEFRRAIQSIRAPVRAAFAAQIAPIHPSYAKSSAPSVPSQRRQIAPLRSATKAWAKHVAWTGAVCICWFLLVPRQAAQEGLGDEPRVSSSMEPQVPPKAVTRSEMPPRPLSSPMEPRIERKEARSVAGGPKSSITTEGVTAERTVPRAASVEDHCDSSSG